MLVQIFGRVEKNITDAMPDTVIMVSRDGKVTIEIHGYGVNVNQNKNRSISADWKWTDITINGKCSKKKQQIRQIKNAANAGYFRYALLLDSSAEEILSYSFDMFFQSEDKKIPPNIVSIRCRNILYDDNFYDRYVRRKNFPRYHPPENTYDSKEKENNI